MNKATEKLQKALSADLTDYQSIPFWSWNNELDEKELVKQIEDMKSVGIGGFIMHARTGLKTEYLGEKWFSCIDACLKKAKELHMNAWVYDENGWPSGFVGGKLLDVEEYRAQYLEYQIKDDFDESAFAVFKKAGEDFIRIDKKGADVDEYYCVYLHTSPANTDILNPDVVDEFINQTHEEYYKRFKDSFGKELVGFFTDEPQYFRWGTPYTREAAKVFKEKYHEDVKDGLIYLFFHNENGYDFRNKYFCTLNDLYTKNFYKKLYDWCEEHNCMLTGHSCEESFLAGQMWCCAGVSPSYEYEHIPGIDCLGRVSCAEMSCKQVSSVSQQLGRKQVLTETFGCSGNDVTPQELKSVAETQYFYGVNLMCQHLYPYSLSAQGKVDHPPAFSKHANWWKGFKQFNDYFTKLGYLVANTKDEYDVLLIHPMRSAYFEYVRSEDGESVYPLAIEFDNLTEYLRMNGIMYHIADETILEKYGKADGDKLIIGNCTYDKVIVPKMPQVSKATLDILNAYTGKMLVLGDVSYVDGKKQAVKLNSNITWEEIKAQAKVQFSCETKEAFVAARTEELGDYIFLKNRSLYNSVDVKLQGVAEKYQALDLETFECKNISNEITLEKCGGLILIKTDDAKAEVKEKVCEEITSAFAVQNITENYLVLDYAQYSLDGKQYSEVQPLPKLFETLLRQQYKGKVYIKQKFVVKDKMPLTFMMEAGDYFSVTLNGNEMALTQSDFDVYFVEADATAFVKEGENEIVYGVNYTQHDGVWFALFHPEATESVRNCLYYDTHIENTYIKGEFALTENFEICKKAEKLPLTSQLNKQGYPFFKGALTLKGEYDYDGVGERVISLSGRFLVAEMLINGVEVVAIEQKKDITQYLQKGKNDIIITLKSSLQNLFGPHHFKGFGPTTYVSPYAFTLRGSWGDGTADMYDSNYYTVPFGVDEIQMIKSK